MRNLNENTITEAVNARLSTDTPPRLREIMTSLTKHLHDFVREVQLTEEEWMQGIQFLTATGQKCDDKRQEFILLSDTLGVSTLCVALNNRTPAPATESTVFGPFHAEGAAFFEAGSDISNGARGTPCFVKGQVRSVTGEPVPHAEIDVWHSDDAGFYDVQTGADEFRCRARLRADEHGNFRFRTIKPAAYPIPDDGPVGQMLNSVGRHPWRPAHIHFLVQAKGYEKLITQVFEDGDRYLDSDAVFGVRSSLVGQYPLHSAGEAYEGSVVDTPFYTLDFDLVLIPQK
jgi:hydroxyquinol 1,2-dioxygenase